MKKIYLIKNQQYGVTSYVGSIDPRVLVRLADQSIEIGQVQEDQRPLDKKHIQEIAYHVGENQGLLPTSIIVGTKVKDKLLFSTFTDIAVTSKKKFDDDFVVEMIQNLEDAKNVDTINGETLFSAPSASLSFRGEGATVKLAEDDGNLLKVFVANKQTAGFNPFD